MSRSTSAEALCCCEYENEKGERSHVLACFCDCEALDQAFDRCITCRAIPKETSERMWSTIVDRCRIPGLTGKGAVKIRWDIAFPIIALPCIISLGTINSYFTVIVLVSMPLVLLLFYRAWRTQHNRIRTQFFFAWAMTSVVFMYVVFLAFVVAFREVLLWENMLLFTTIALMFLSLYYARRDPGSIKGQPRRSPSKMCSEQDVESQAANQDEEMSAEKFNTNDEYEKVVANHALGNFLLSNMGFEKESFKGNYEAQTAPTLEEKEVTWVDSRPIMNGQLITWCNKCGLVRPARAGHCNVCESCISNRDHHCVWIDNCIGASNHRSFLAAVILFVFSGFYGAHLTMTTICTPEMYFDWFLFPNDCRFVYVDFPTAVSYVSACYVLIGSSMMCFALVVQLILISQNVTSQELHMAAIRGMTVLGLYARGNIHNRGIIRNWVEFICGHSRRSSIKIPI